jgi:hypothetical protein
MAEQAPDPARSYERAKPEAESGMGRLDNNKGTPTRRADKMDQAVTHKQSPHQINAEDDNSPAAGPLMPQPDHSMHEEEPDGWDQAPTDIHNPREKRHPRKEGKGGTP